MKKYLSFFRLRFSMALQYRTAAFAGLITQFVWGSMLILSYRAFYRADPSAFPMSLQATSSYVWMQQAFLMLFQAWGFEGEILESIQSGAVAYELCRPISIYDMWFSRSVANRMAAAMLRCGPTLILALLLPKPYGMVVPGFTVLLCSIISMVLGTLVACALCMLVYLATFFTVNAAGVRVAAAAATDFLQGFIIPLPFMPDGVRRMLELLPFASTANTPLRIFAGDITGSSILTAIALQIFWLAALVALGKVIERKAVRKTVVQGG